MRNGQYKNNVFLIQVSMLTERDKEVLMLALKDKCGMSSRLTMKGTRLAITNPELVVAKLRPLFHTSQLHRLNKKSY